MHKVPTNRVYPRTRYTWRERAFVLAGIGVAAAVTAISLALGWGLEPAGPVWAAAIGWTVVANLAHVLWRGFRLGDWSAFRDYEPPGVDHDAGDSATGTGAYAYRQLTDPFWRHLPGNIHYASTDDGTRFFTDPTHSCLPGNIHHHSFPD